jgi:hypothetical protein
VDGGAVSTRPRATPAGGRGRGCVRRLEQRIVRIPARTLAGIIAKARCVAGPAGFSGRWGFPHPMRCLKSMKRPPFPAALSLRSKRDYDQTAFPPKGAVSVVAPYPPDTLPRRSGPLASPLRKSTQMFRKPEGFFEAMKTKIRLVLWLSTARDAAPRPNAETDRELGKAFFGQESDISDLLTMANIAARAPVGSERGETIFTAHHLADMIEEFRQRWHDSVKEAPSA